MLFYKFHIFLQILAYQSFAQARNVNEGLKAKGAITNTMKTDAKRCIFLKRGIKIGTFPPTKIQVEQNWQNLGNNQMKIYF